MRHRHDLQETAARLARSWRLGEVAYDASERLGRDRWVVERSLAWLLACRRLSVRYERRADLLQGLLHLACALLCCRFLIDTVDKVSSLR